LPLPCSGVTWCAKQLCNIVAICILVVAAVPPWRLTEIYGKWSRFVLTPHTSRLAPNTTTLCRRGSLIEFAIVSLLKTITDVITLPIARLGSLPL
jgi:hypothetical protein